MVDFFDITFDEDWIYATRVYDHDNKSEGTARISRHSDEFYTDCNKKNRFKKAMLSVKLDLIKGRLRQHSNRTVCWG